MHKNSGKKATKTTNKQAGHFKITFLVHYHKLIRLKPINERENGSLNATTNKSN
jgi:hypothetical protein